MLKNQLSKKPSKKVKTYSYHKNSKDVPSENASLNLSSRKDERNKQQSIHAIAWISRSDKFFQP